MVRNRIYRALLNDGYREEEANELLHKFREAAPVDSPLDFMVMPKRFERDGFEIKYIGRGDGIARHYPNSFITASVDKPWNLRKDNRRIDTAKCLPNCLHVWEYFKI